MPPPSFTRTRQQIHLNFVIKIFAIYLPSQPSLGHQLGFHIFFHHGFLWATPFFLQFGCFGLDLFCICILQNWPMASFGACLSSLLQEGETRCKAVVELNIVTFFYNFTIFYILNFSQQAINLSYTNPLGPGMVHKSEKFIPLKLCIRAGR